MDQSIWRSSFPKARIPAYPCPECGSGRLGLRPNSYQSQEARHIKDWKEDNDLDDQFDGERFICFLICDDSHCGDIVAVAGSLKTEEVVDNDGNQRFVAVLSPAMMHPSPHIINVSVKLKPSVKEVLLESFELYWADKAACANRIRAAVEMLLDGYKIPRTTINKQKKRVDLSLSSRIDKFEKKVSGHKQALTALRHIGNAGSHQGGNTEGEVLLAYQLLEMVLAELIDKKSQDFAKLITKVIKTKGKLK